MRQRALVETPGFPARSIEDMLASLAVPAAGQFAGDGWRHLLPTRSGFHHAYNRDVASGGWEFHQLVPGLCLALTDMSARRTIPRRHRLQDQFVLSTMVEGCIPTNGPQGEDGCFEPGYSTLYGMNAGAELKTLYKPGAALRWVSIFIDRHAFCELTGLDTAALPPALREYVEHGGNLAQQSLALSRASRKIVTQMLGGADNPRLRHAFLVAKSFELIGNLLADIIQEEQDPSRSNLSSRDHEKLDHAMRLLRRNIENPLSVNELAEMVGLTRQKLQHGFRIVHGDTVAQVRDRGRMEFAMQRLRTTDQPITEIAMEAGYEYLASFTRAFRGAFGMSPSQARRLRAKR